MTHVLKKTTDRFVLYPIKHLKLFEYYKKHVACFWTTEEVDLSCDEWDKLEHQEQQFIIAVLAFFAASDGLVIENLITNFMSEVMLPEARSFYTFQAAMESIHSEQYALLLQKFVPNEEDRLKQFKAVDNHRTTKAKADWVLKRMMKNEKIDPVTDFSLRLIAQAVTEGIFFSASFASIFWLKNRDIRLPGLCMSNEFISRDEGLHRDFACELYKEFPRLPKNVVYDIVDSGVKLEKDFVAEICPERLKNMNSELLSQYVEYVADHLLVTLGYTKFYNTKIPDAFAFMEMISLEGKTNFFERRVSEYSKADVGTGSDNTFTLDSKF